MDKFTAEIKQVVLPAGKSYDEGYAEGETAQYIAEIKDGVLYIRTKTYAEISNNILYLKKENTV